MKQWFLSLIILLASGFTDGSFDRVPASDLLENDCPREENISLYESIKNMLGRYSRATTSLISQSENANNFNLQSFSAQFSFSPSDMYNSAYFQSMNQEALNSYQVRVTALQNHRVQRLAQSWSPQFDQYGGLANGFYGFGPHTSQAIRSMYGQPTVENPYMLTVSYYSVPALEVGSATQSLPSAPNPEYYGPQ